MITLERGPRKKRKKLYRFKQFGTIPFFIWRTEIGIDERKFLSLAGFRITNVPKEKEGLMDIKVKGVRKRGRVLIEVTLGYDGDRFYFYRTSSSCLTRDYLESVGIEVKKYGCKIRQRKIRKKK